MFFLPKIPFDVFFSALFLFFVVAMSSRRGRPVLPLRAPRFSVKYSLLSFLSFSFSFFFFLFLSLFLFFLSLLFLSLSLLSFPFSSLSFFLSFLSDYLFPFHFLSLSFSREGPSSASWLNSRDKYSEESKLRNIIKIFAICLGFSCLLSIFYLASWQMKCFSFFFFLFLLSFLIINFVFLKMKKT